MLTPVTRIACASSADDATILGTLDGRHMIYEIDASEKTI